MRNAKIGAAQLTLPVPPPQLVTGLYIVCGDCPTTNVYSEISVTTPEIHEYCFCEWRKGGREEEGEKIGPLPTSLLRILNVTPNLHMVTKDHGMLTKIEI